MNRRDFTTAFAATPLALALAPAARAQGAPAEGKQYTRLPQPVIVTPAPPAGQVDVIEFFSFACPHCDEFEPLLETWLKQPHPDVRFRRVPVPFLFNFQNFQKLYFAMETMGVADRLQQKVFDSVHREHERLLAPDAISAFMARNGVDAAKFMAVFNSFAMGVKANQAQQLVSQFNVTQIPTLAIGGRYTTSAGAAGGPDKVLHVVDYLVQQVKAGH